MSESDELYELCRTLWSSRRQYPDFPKPGILFEDMLPLFASPSLKVQLLRALELHITLTHPPSLTPPFAGVDVILGLEARGFLLGLRLTLKLGAAFVPVRKVGKLPGETLRAEYVKGYGTDVFEIQKAAVKEGKRVLIVDDIVATGGSARAAQELVEWRGLRLSSFTSFWSSSS